MSEHRIQVKLINELTWRMRPELVRFAIPNGGLRNGRVAVKMKAEGLMPGMPDLGFAIEDGRTAWLEMKTDKGSLSDMQWGVRRKLEQLGHQWAMARSVEEAMDHLARFGVAEMTNAFLATAELQQNAYSKARDRAAEKRLAKLFVKSDADAPMVVSPAEKQMFEQSKLLRLYNEDLTQRRLDLLNGPHGKQVKELLQIMDSLTPSSAPGLLSFLARCNWFLQAERGIRQNILSLISIGIMRHRIRQGLAPFDDSLPGEEPTAFEVIRKNMKVLS